MLFRDRSTSQGHVVTESSSLLARLVGCALPVPPRRRPNDRRPSLAFQTLEPRLVMSSSLDLNGGMPDDDTTSHPPGCACGCCITGNLSALAAIETTSAPDESGGGEQSPLASLPLLSSNPDADVKLYLDFDGHFESQWGAYSNITTPAFSKDSDFSSFSTAEIDAITEIWKRVSEDYAPFNIDVTTIDPGSFENGEAMRVVIGGNSSWYGSTVGGLGYVNSFTDSVVNTVYVFSDNLAKNAHYIAEASSHEAGHSFGLRHQSTYVDGTKTNEYNPGSGDWAPIMGQSYYKARSTWSNGTSYSATAYQDDMEVIARAANGFGYRTDDHGDLNSATSLTFVGNTATASGIVEKMTDQDGFSFTASAGQLNLQLDVAAIGANLDSVLELWTQSGELIATANPSDSYGATISTTVDGGDYVLIVRSTGEYGSVGQYTISATRAALATEVAISGESSVAEDEVFTLQLNEVVAGSTPIQSWTIDWGDGTIQNIAGNPGSATHVYSDGVGAYTIQATATDGEDTFAAEDLVVTVFDPVPDLAISGAGSTTEGTTYHLSLSSAGAGAESISKWTINWGDGTIQVISGNPNTAEHVYADGTAVFSVQATATNAYGTYAANSKSVTVNNAAATVQISGNSEVDGGNTYVLGLSSTDLGDDTIAHWTINWGDGTIEQINGDPESATHTYAVSGGQFTISATATDEDGTYAADSLTVNVAEEMVSSLNYNNFVVGSYGNGQDQDGEDLIDDGGATLILMGNTWKRINFNYHITVDTVLEFEFRSDKAAEVQAIGLDIDLDHDKSRAFQLAGTDNWGLQNYRLPGGDNSEMVRFVIPVGKFYTGDVQYLFFINDDDVANPQGECTFSNVRVYESLSAHNDYYEVDEGEGPFTFNVLANDAKTTGVTDPLQIVTVGEGSAGGSIAISGDGTRLIYTPAAGFYGTETFSYTISDGESGKQSIGQVRVVVKAATDIEGDDETSAGSSYVLHLSSRDGLTVSNWTVDWGDGTIQNIAGDPTYVTHTYQNAGRRHTITATAANGGSQYASLSHDVDVSVPKVNFASHPIRTYAGKQDANGTATSVLDGRAMRLKGNVWKRISMPMTITRDTVLEFDLRILREGEIHGIGFDNDWYHSVKRTFQLRGTDTWGIQDFRTSSGENGTVHYVIPIGQFYRGYVKYLFFVNDQDVFRPRAECVYSNLKVYEFGPAAEGAGAPMAPTATAPAAVEDSPFETQSIDLATALAAVDESLISASSSVEPTVAEVDQLVPATVSAAPQSLSTGSSWTVTPWHLGDSLAATTLSQDSVANELFFALYDGTLD